MFSSYYYPFLNHDFNIDNAFKILKFEIPHKNKNLEINNDLFNNAIAQKLLKKVKKIKEYYDNIKKSSHSLNDFANNIKRIISKKENDFDEKLIASMIYANEEIYKQTPRVVQIISLLYFVEGYIQHFNLIK